VNYEQDYFVKFPNDVIVTKCDGTGNYGEPVFFGEDCELLGVSFEDDVFTVVPDACMKIERTWTIINWCTYNPNGSCVIVPNPNPNATSNSPQNLPGPIVSACGTPAPWNPTIVAIAPGQPQTNYSHVLRRERQLLQVQTDHQDHRHQKTDGDDLPGFPGRILRPDGERPTVVEPVVLVGCSNGIARPVRRRRPLTITATDSCSGANVNISYLLFLDLDGDGRWKRW
jgi:hypothetical protein